MEKIKKFISSNFPVSLIDAVIFTVSMCVGAAICFFLRQITTSDVHVPMIFILVVLIISLTTNGYFFGTLAALVSVFAVNWAFTYPYMKLDFSIYGYPLTFITMLAVGIAASTLATRIKEEEKIRIESEREKITANLLRSISHDLRTPLTAISGSISAVLDNDTMSENQTRELLSNAKDNADWLCNVVENLLSVTKINGSHDICKTSELIEEVLSEAALKFKNNNPGISVNVSCPAEPLFVPMDAMLIEQVLINLMNNAVIHGVTTKTIDICAFEVPNDNQIEIHVKDDGIGIEKTIISKLFDGSLLLSHTDHQQNGKYMGIGLSVCQTIINAHGGIIYANQNCKSGAEFIFTLPKENEIHDN